MSIQEIIGIFTKPLITSFFVSAITTPLVIKFFTKMRWLDNPKNGKRINITHTYPVPRGGGIPIFLAILITSLLFIYPDKQLISILLAILITLLVGIVDDIFNISPYFRFLTNILAALIIINSGIQMKFISNPLQTGKVIYFDNFSLPILGSEFISKFISLVWLIWCMNIIGWSGGIEGQLPGFVIVTATIIGIIGISFGQDITQWPLIILAGTLAGAYLGFLPYNFYPQKIMPGYSGKSIAGLMLGTLAILSGAKVATAILVLGIPMIDGILAIVRRFSQGKSPFWGDAQHLHHLLLNLGIHKAKIAILYWIFSIILGAIVINLNSQQKLYTFIILFILVISLTLIIKGLIERKNRS